MSESFPPSKPRRVTGGVTARSRRGEIAQSWWSRRFLDGLEAIGVGGRLSRGRSYARAGQVVELTVTAGSVTALVQGSRAKPYRVRVGLTAFGKGEWATVEQALTDDAWYAASLLAGTMPTDIEDVFTGCGLPLFPASTGQLSLDCSCPDWSVPCKHLAAVLYLLAEAFDADPFTLLALRGRTREDLLGNLRARRGSAVPGASTDTTPPLADCLDSYFTAGSVPPPSPQPGVPSDALLDQLPPIDVTVRGQPLTDLLRPAYRALGGAP